jgi:deoxyribonuclease-4
MVLLEHTAGQGRTIGHRFEHLAAIIAQTDGSSRVGVCLDTCHLIASGYDIVSAEGYAETFAAFDRLIGFDRLRAVHANDSPAVRRPADAHRDPEVGRQRRPAEDQRRSARRAQSRHTSPLAGDGADL